MLNATRAFARAVDLRVGWHRVGIAISLLIIAIAAHTLFNQLRDIDLAKVADALRDKPPRSILLAGAFVVASYVTLTLYDFFALRTIGRYDVPYRTAALASFTSYSIGHNLGATALTAALVRFRVYAPWDLGILDIAKIGFVTGLTFWLGNAFVLGVSMAYAPEVAGAVSQLPAPLNRAAALAALTVIGAYLLWLMPRRRAIGRDGWQVVLPSARLTLAQIGIGILDLGLGSLAMYMLLPAAPPLDPLSALVTYVIATLLGFLSHAPGSLGVFEAAMLVGLAQFEKEQLLAALLVFRFLYFVIPLVLAVTVLGLREAWLAARKR